MSKKFLHIIKYKSIRSTAFIIIANSLLIHHLKELQFDLVETIDAKIYLSLSLPATLPRRVVMY